MDPRIARFSSASARRTQDGLRRRIRLGNLEIHLRRTTPRNMATAGRPAGLVIQALRWMGRRHVTDATVAQLRRSLDPDKRQSLLADRRYAPAWIAQIMKRVSETGPGA